MKVPAKLLASRALIPLVLVGIVLLFIAGLALLNHVSAPQIQASWDAPTTDFSADDQRSIIDSLTSTLQQSSRSASGGSVYVITDAQRLDDQAVLSAVQRLGSDGPTIATEPLIVIAEKHGSDWATWTPQSQDFCDALKRLPDQLLPQGSKDYFTGCFAQ